LPALELNDAALYWEELGQGPPVLLIPGTGFRTDMWGPFPTELAKSRRVILYERRGFNRSAALPARHMRQHAADAAVLLARLGAEPATVLGWSGGGLVALALTVEHPDFVERLVLMEPSLHMLKHVDRSLLSTMARQMYTRLVKRDPEGATELLYRWVFSYSTGGSAYDRFPEEWRLELRRNAEATKKESNQEASFYPHRRRVAAIDVPITCVIGELSAYRRPSLYLARIHPGVDVVELPGASHAVHLDDPVGFLAVLERAIR
jgi:pimeloyl-ACP methyl ester carboxylesterase